MIAELELKNMKPQDFMMEVEDLFKDKTREAMELEGQKAGEKDKQKIYDQLKCRIYLKIGKKIQRDFSNEFDLKKFEESKELFNKSLLHNKEYYNTWHHYALLNYDLGMYY